MRQAGFLILLALAGCSAAEDQERDFVSAAQCDAIAEAQMIWVEGGSFVMGDDPLYPEEGAPRSVSVDGFWMSQTEVTNAQFAKFDAETGCKTIAQRAPPSS